MSIVMVLVAIGLAERLQYSWSTSVPGANEDATSDRSVALVGVCLIHASNGAGLVKSEKA